MVMKGRSPEVMDERMTNTSAEETHVQKENLKIFSLLKSVQVLEMTVQLIEEPGPGSWEITKQSTCVGGPGEGPS